jgi:hypothetical protein
MRHGLCIYGSDGRLGDDVGAFLAQGADAGETVFAVFHAGHERVLRGALGSSADDVRFVNRDAFYTRPEEAVAGYDAAIRRALAAGAPGVRAAGDLPAVTSEGAWGDWIAYDAIVNRAMARHDVSILCAYDIRETPAWVLDAAREAHPAVLDGGCTRRRCAIRRRPSCARTRRLRRP